MLIITNNSKINIMIDKDQLYITLSEIICMIAFPIIAFQPLHDTIFGIEFLEPFQHYTLFIWFMYVAFKLGEPIGGMLALLILYINSIFE
jgi:hypothetical protein